MNPKLRRKVLDRDNHRCSQCNSKRRLEIHHIHPVNAGGKDTLDNLTTLCLRCHTKVHAGEEVEQLMVGKLYSPHSKRGGRPRKPRKKKPKREPKSKHEPIPKPLPPTYVPHRRWSGVYSKDGRWYAYISGRYIEYLDAKAARNALR